MHSDPRLSTHRGNDTSRISSVDIAEEQLKLLTSADNWMKRNNMDSSFIMCVLLGGSTTNPGSNSSNSSNSSTGSASSRSSSSS